MSKNEISYISTRNGNESKNFSGAMEQGLARDGGLFIPDRWPDLSDKLWNHIESMSITDIGSALAQTFVPEIPADRLESLVEDAISFDAPLVHLHDDLYVLELFHGPTLAFKDYGARFMARMMSYRAEQASQRMVILVATSGDTGSAVGRAFEGVDNVDVCLLYPSGKVSPLQEQQLTTIGGNVTALEVEGTFDDCQKLVKDAFSDSKLRDELILSSANSINIARLLPQMFYYGRGLAQLEESDSVHFCVPSGNFGNLTAGMMAAQTGMSVGQFIAGTNVNDVVPEFLESGNFSPRASQKTISSAMDVGNPSNLERIRSFYPDVVELRQHLWAASFNDDACRTVIEEVYQSYDYILDPHTAVGYLAANSYRKEQESDQPVIILGTAHPAKFSDIVEPLIDTEIPLPGALKESMEKEKKSVRMYASYPKFKSFLREQYS
ncbi:threonine synthase [Aliifodinibius salicampi]|uniref:Threonine synthase n=1 Tax=Fodinibius salicampi TaxID=1920655 RepID=A0ABT3PY44_9BACT|nr:threonine synthase [Fodinibius salicampi]MCW9712766.1 threonine synthase [Fodinibius salicampi]